MGVDFKEVLESSSDTSVSQDDPIWTHIVRGDGTRSAEAIVTEARVLGIAVTALCGHTWVPSRDPQRHPLCTKCEELADPSMTSLSNTTITCVSGL